MKEYEKHIRSTRHGEEGLAICGAKIETFTWSFVNIDHWFHSQQAEDRLFGCPDCLEKIKEALK